jgi:hypothetical protein
MNQISSILSSLRREYISEPLTEASVSDDPFEQFRFWFDEMQSVPSSPDPEAMTLSTATRDGVVSARDRTSKGFRPERIRLLHQLPEQEESRAARKSTRRTDLLLAPVKPPGPNPGSDRKGRDRRV